MSRMYEDGHRFAIAGPMTVMAKPSDNPLSNSRTITMKELRDVAKAAGLTLVPTSRIRTYRIRREDIAPRIRKDIEEFNRHMHRSIANELGVETARMAMRFDIIPPDEHSPYPDRTIYQGTLVVIDTAFDLEE